MSGKAADLNVTVVRPGGQGYAALGLGWIHPDGGWRVRCWAKPGAGRVGLFLPEGVSGTLPTRVMLHTSAGERLGSGAFVPGLRGVMVRVDAWPTLEGGGCWLLVRVPNGAGMINVAAKRTAGPTTQAWG